MRVLKEELVDSLQPVWNNATQSMILAFIQPVVL